MTRVLARLGLLIAVASILVVGPARAAPSDDDSTAAAPSPASWDGSWWKPESSYWAGFRTVFVEVVCDSAGRALRAEPMFSYASRAMADSVLVAARGVTIDPETSAGKMWWRSREYPSDPTIHFIVPFLTSHPDTAIPALPATREELEHAGLGPWLAIWDDLLPGWPLETWPNRWPCRLRDYPPEVQIADSVLVARGLVSVSPDGRWRLHPFASAEVEPDGELAFDVDSGFVLYPSAPPRSARGYTDGTVCSYDAAEWIDESRFVIPGSTEASVGYRGKGVSYRAPFLLFGRVDASTTIEVQGPPVPVDRMAEAWKRLKAYRDARYPRFHRAPAPASK